MRKTPLLVLGLIFFLELNHSNALSAESRAIAIVNSRTIAPYNDAVSGFKEELRRNGYDVDISYYDFEASREKELLKGIADLHPDMFFTLGTEATLFIKENFIDLPIVFSMVLNPVESGIIKSLDGSGENLSGVCLDIPIESQFEKIKEFLPNLKRIGMLYDAEKKGLLEKAARAAANKLELDLVARPVHSEADVTRILDEVLEESDCLWAGIDTLVYNQQSAKYILMATLRHKTPFMAFSYNYVKAGALFALECNYMEIGRQSAQIAMRILQGENPQVIPVEHPKKTRLAINQKIAEVIGIAIPRKLSEEAAEIYGVE